MCIVFEYEGLSMKRLNDFSFLCVMFFFLFLVGCVEYNSPPEAIYSENYTTANLDNNSEDFLLPTEKLSKAEAVDIALKDSPGYKVSQLKETAAWANYYAALGVLSPVMTLGAGQIPNVGAGVSGFSTNYQAFSGFSTTMNVLSSRSVAEASSYEVANYRRLLVETVIVEDNKIQKASSDIKIQQENERFQQQMALKAMDKYQQCNTVSSDVLNFKIKELNAKAAVIENERKYKTESYALAKTMGQISGELPKKPTNLEKKIVKKKEEILSLNYYLDLAIENRPDLKAEKEILKSFKYKMYGAVGELSPTVDLGAGGGNISLLVSSTVTGGSKIANVRSSDAQYNANQEALLKKWIEVVKDVRTEYVKLKGSIAMMNVYANTLSLVKKRRDYIELEYTKGSKDIAVLNQAQKDYVNVQRLFVESRMNVSNAKARLCAACGVESLSSK
jgi:outer membrane protein